MASRDGRVPPRETKSLGMNAIGKKKETSSTATTDNHRCHHCHHRRRLPLHRLPILRTYTYTHYIRMVSKQPSRKGKKAWRKNVDISAVQTGLEQLRSEIIHGSVPISSTLRAILRQAMKRRD